MINDINPHLGPRYLPSPNDCSRIHEHKCLSTSSVEFPTVSQTSPSGPNPREHQAASWCDATCDLRTSPFRTVRLGKSGLKVSRIILGCMSYGTPEWQKWVLGEEEGIAQIKFACVNPSCHHHLNCLRPLLISVFVFDSAGGSNSVQLRERHSNLRHRRCESSVPSFATVIPPLP